MLTCCLYCKCESTDIKTILLHKQKTVWPLTFSQSDKGSEIESVK